MTAATLTGPHGPPVVAAGFDLPDDLIAAEPVEASGGRRHDARMMVAWRSRDRLEHTTFAALPAFLEAGDVVVVNTSATLPAAVPTDDGLLVHLSTRLPGDLWLVELRVPNGAGSEPFFDGRAGRRLDLPGGGAVELLAPYPAGAPRHDHPARLWYAVLHLPEAVAARPSTVPAYLAEFGRPIRYGYADRAFPLSDYQTVFALEPGSAEMPSAARPFTPEVVTALVSKGVGVTPIVLHTGVSSAEPGEMPYPERYRVPVETADRVNAAHRRGHRVIAVGTTVTRALESAVDETGTVHPAHGWTELVVTPERGALVVDGLLTGWHPPAGSHLLLVEAVGGRAAVDRSYAAALELGYRWHEFGDVHLLLP